MKIYWALNQGNKITLPHIKGSKKLEFKHVLWASSSHVLLVIARSNYLFFLVNAWMEFRWRMTFLDPCSLEVRCKSYLPSNKIYSTQLGQRDKLYSSHAYKRNYRCTECIVALQAHMTMNSQNQIHKTELEENLNSSMSFGVLACLSLFII